jgi:hypothetical protein
MKGTVRFNVGRGRVESQLFEVDKRVLGFAGPTSSMHYVMRMEERFTEAKLASSEPIKESSLLTKKSTRIEKPSTETKPEEIVPKVATKPQTPATTTPVTTTPPPRRSSPSRRSSSRSASRNNFGKPTHVR